MKQCPPLAGLPVGRQGLGVDSQSRLVMEVDGYPHFLDGIILKDKIKGKALKQAGYEAIRFTDTLVLKYHQNVITGIEKTIEELKRLDVGKFVKVHPQPLSADRQARQRGTSPLTRHMLKKISFLLKNKNVNDIKGFINQNRYSY